MKNLFVTQPLLPPLEEFVPFLEQIWETKQLTNAGPFHTQLEAALTQYLGIEHISLFANGTIALLVALQALGVTGEVITTPYSFVATAHALLWNGITPVFADISREGFGLNADAVEASITPRTTALLAVHVYGFPAQVEQLQRIAATYGLKLIYDAAHAFGVKHGGTSILNFGDLSILSFHATKVFNTFEGGAIISRDGKMKQRVDYMKNFGFADEVTVVAPGINGKMNEIQAAFGLLQLRHIDHAIERRSVIDGIYRKALAAIDGIEVPALPPTLHNYAYFPILVSEGFPISRDALYFELRKKGVNGRRYFYPLISTFPKYRELPSAAPGCLPVAHDIASRILCLPIYPAMTDEDVFRVVNAMRNAC